MVLRMQPRRIEVKVVLSEVEFVTRNQIRLDMSSKLIFHLFDLWWICVVSNKWSLSLRVCGILQRRRAAIARLQSPRLFAGNVIDIVTIRDLTAVPVTSHYEMISAEIELTTSQVSSSSSSQQLQE